MNQAEAKAVKYSFIFLIKTFPDQPGPVSPQDAVNPTTASLKYAGWTWIRMDHKKGIPRSDQVADKRARCKGRKGSCSINSYVKKGNNHAELRKRAPLKIPLHKH